MASYLRILAILNVLPCTWVYKSIYMHASCWEHVSCLIYIYMQVYVQNFKLTVIPLFDNCMPATLQFKISYPNESCTYTVLL